MWIFYLSFTILLDYIYHGACILILLYPIIGFKRLIEQDGIVHFLFVVKVTINLFLSGPWYSLITFWHFSVFCMSWFFLLIQLPIYKSWARVLVILSTPCRPGVRSIVTGFLPSAILNAFIYVVPFCMIAMAKLAGYISRSKRDIKACDMVFYFLVGNVFFLSLLSGSLFDQINDYFGHPKDFPSHLAKAVTAQVKFILLFFSFNCTHSI